MAFMKDILTRNIPIWEECAATPFVQEVQTGKLPLEKFKRYMIQDSIYLKTMPAYTERQFFMLLH